jgi:hypothetical protein
VVVEVDDEDEDLALLVPDWFVELMAEDDEEVEPEPEPETPAKPSLAEMNAATRRIRH